QRSQKFIPFLQPRIAPQPIAHTVVLYGPAGVGKSTLAKQVFLDWAENNLNQMFNYVFYLRCKELNHVGACSFAELIFKDWPEWLGCAAEVFGQAQKILFIIDGFEELRVPAGALIHDICGNWEREDLGKLEMEEEDLCPFLDKGVLQRGCDGCYSLIHLSVQQFLAAMYYILDSEEQEEVECHRWDIREVQKLFSKEERVRNPSLTQVGYFLFGLSNEKRVQELESTFGCRMSLQIREELLKYRANLDENKPFSRTDMKELLYCLYESQDEGLMRDAMVPFTEVSLHWMNTFEVMYSSFCLKHCQNLQKLSLQIARGIFLENDPVSREDAQLESWSRCDHRSLCVWMDFCSVVSSNKNLKVLDMTQSFLSDSSVRILCDHITRFSCHLQKVVKFYQEIKTSRKWRHMLGIPGRETGKYVSTFSNSNDELMTSVTGMALRNESGQGRVKQMQTQMWTGSILLVMFSLDFTCHVMSDKENSEQCLYLFNTVTGRHRRGLIETRKLENCHLTEACCKQLASVLVVSQQLTYLSLAKNDLGDGGVKFLCEGLGYPECKLQTLVLVLRQCNISRLGCKHLSKLFQGHSSLTSLDLGLNCITTGLWFLCKALKNPFCNLKYLGLWGCSLTPFSCQDLSSALLSNQKLESLDLGQNNLGQSGVTLLFEALKQKNGPLKTLRLKAYESNLKIQVLLEYIKENNPQLTIDCDAARTTRSSSCYYLS
uniref:NACHT domain-containing protein n=1 Tax=Otolemur garnettii TaxID=30611 RepID=H0WIA8_OTOGA